MRHAAILCSVLLLLCACGPRDNGGAPLRGSRYAAVYTARAEGILRRTAAKEPAELIAWFERVPYFQDGHGDPHKYALPVVLARLHADPADAEALGLYRWLMAVDELKGDRGLYHFAIFQRTRLYFQFKDRLPKDVVASNRHDAAGWFAVMLGDRQRDHHGTENHTFMHRCSAYLWAEELGGADPDSDWHDEYTFLRGWLIEQTRRLYTIGQGEYDSSTYVGFTLASWSNVYDFARDPEIRQVARAAMDWLVTALARKYYHGCQLGPEARGFARRAVGSGPARPKRNEEDPTVYPPVGSLSDWVCWLYFGNSARGVDVDGWGIRVPGAPLQVLALSDYRPPRVLRRIATKRVAMPYAARGAKPAYYGDRGSKDQETLFVNHRYAMGTLYSPEAGVRTRGTILPQTTMFKLLLRREGGIAACGAANGYHGHFPLEGRSPYDQYHQHRGAGLNVCWIPDEEDARIRHRSLFGFPAVIGEPTVGETAGPPRGLTAVKDPDIDPNADFAPDWYCWRVGKAFLAVRPLNGVAELRDTVTRAKRGEAVPAKTTGYRFLVSPGRLGGWAVQLSDVHHHQDLYAFRRAIAERCRLDLSRFATDREVTFTTLDGHVLRLRHSGGPGGRPEAWTDGEALDFETPWPVFSSPYIKQDQGAGVLELSDGERTLSIDVNRMPPIFSEGFVGVSAED